MRPTAVLEQGDLVVRLPSAGVRAHQIIEITPHAFSRNDARSNGHYQFADMSQRGRSTVNEQRGMRDKSIVRLAHVCLVGADQIDMGAGPHPVPEYDWLARHGRR